VGIVARGVLQPSIFIEGKIAGKADNLKKLNELEDIGGGATLTGGSVSGDTLTLNLSDGSNVVISGFGDTSNLFATNGEVQTGTATDKVASVLQLETYYADITGDNHNGFDVAKAKLGSTQAVGAIQFADIINHSEASDDWNAA
jgi:hypothetical protein